MLPPKVEADWAIGIATLISQRATNVAVAVLLGSAAFLGAIDILQYCSAVLINATVNGIDTGMSSRVLSAGTKQATEGSIAYFIPLVRSTK